MNKASLLPDAALVPLCLTRARSLPFHSTHEAVSPTWRNGHQNAITYICLAPGNPQGEAGDRNNQGPQVTIPQGAVRLLGTWGHSRTPSREGVMSENENGREKSTTWLLPSVNQHREYVVSGRLVTVHEKAGVGPTETASPESHDSQTPSGGRALRDFKLMGFPITRTGRAPERRTDLLEAPEILTLDE